MKLLKKLKEIWEVNKREYFISLAVVALGAFLITGGNNYIYALSFGVFFVTIMMFAVGLFFVQ